MKAEKSYISSYIYMYILRDLFQDYFIITYLSIQYYPFGSSTGG